MGVRGNMLAVGCKGEYVVSKGEYVAWEGEYIGCKDEYVGCKGEYVGCEGKYVSPFHATDLFPYPLKIWTLVSLLLTLNIFHTLL